jgi:hypothetical protein
VLHLIHEAVGGKYVHLLMQEETIHGTVEDETEENEEEEEDRVKHGSHRG